MSVQPFNPGEYKNRQRNEWNNVACGWERWWESFEMWFGVVSDSMVDMAGIKEGYNVLDIATGVGEPAVTAAKRVGQYGRVAAADQSTHMLDIARKRAHDLALKNLDFYEMDAECLDFEPSSFDAVLCRWGLMFFPNIVQAITNIRQLLVPGGKFVATVWGVPSNVPMLSIPMSVVRKIFELPPPPPDAPSLFNLASPGVLEQAFKNAGFESVRLSKIKVTTNLNSTDAYIDMLKDVCAPVVTLIAERTPEKQDEVWQAISDAAQEFVKDNGICMSNETICVVGEKAV